MNLTDRSVLTGLSALVVLPTTFLLFTPSALADPLPQSDSTVVSEPGLTKAQVEYRERQQLADHRSKAQIEHDELVILDSKVQAPVESPSGSGETGAAAWQLAVSTLAGGLIGGGVAVGARSVRHSVAH